MKDKIYFRLDGNLSKEGKNLIEDLKKIWKRINKLSTKEKDALFKLFLLSILADLQKKALYEYIKERTKVPEYIG